MSQLRPTQASHPINIAEHTPPNIEEVRYRELFAPTQAPPQSGPLPDFLKQKAERVLTLGSWSVCQKSFDPPSGDPHDYMSLSRYYHPNPATVDGLPYIARDGIVNPEIGQYDYGKLSQLVHAIQLLSLAYGRHRDPRYAEHAALLLKAWFIQPATRMNPHLKFAQYIPGGAGVAGPPTYPPRWVEGRPGRGLYVSYGGAIEGSCFPLLLDALRPFTESAAFSPALWEGLRAWFSEFLDWLLASPLGQDEKNTRNNHALWYRVQVASYALFTGRRDLAQSVIETELPALLEAQMAEDGSLPEECWRAIPLTYIYFALAALFNLAQLGEELGLKDRWHRKTENGKSIHRGALWFARHLLEQPPKAGGHEDKTRVEALCRMLMSRAAALDQDPIFRQVLDLLPPWPDHDERGLLFPVHPQESR